MINNFFRTFFNSICKCCKNRNSKSTEFKTLTTVALIEVKFIDHSVLYRIGKINRPTTYEYILQDTKLIRKSNQETFDKQSQSYDYLVEIEYIVKAVEDENAVIETFLDQVVRDYIKATPDLKENSYGKFYVVDSSKQETKTLKYVRNDCPYEYDEWI